jgi:DUF1009 family protein
MAAADARAEERAGSEARPGPVAIFAGGGRLPGLVAEGARRHGRETVVFAIARETDPAAYSPSPVHVVRWGGVGRMFRLLEANGCREAVFIGSIARRPNYLALIPDLATLKLLPRILRLMRGRDGNLLAGVADIFEERGVRILSPLDVAPELALEEGCAVGRITDQSESDIAAAAAAAREVGRRDIAQGAVAVAGQVIAEEDAGGTDALLERVALLRRAGAIAGQGGVLVKCLKPIQDGRHDLPTIGPATAEGARRAGLAGVAAEAGRSMLVGRDETLEAFRRAGLFLAGLSPAQLGRG